MHMPLVIALTGGIGSGKSTVAAIFKELGADVIDTDEIAHQLTAAGQPGARAVRDQFGAAFLRADGALDRDRMRELVFADSLARRKLEAILHPLIRVQVGVEADAAVRRAPDSYLVIVVPLLIETGAYRDLAQRILVVDCTEELQIARASRRSGLDAAAVRAIIASQASRAERRSHADDIVTNDADVATLRAAVTALHRKYLALAQAGVPPR